jgi:environmental stress-induced protein Ves
VRVSLADVGADGPFSAFPGVRRWFAVVEGAGVILRWPDAERRLVPGDAPLEFDGAAPPDCRLIGGATRDLNLMSRTGHAVMRPVESGVEWTEPWRWRALFAARAGTWCDGDDVRHVGAGVLLWSDEPESAAWSFEADDAGSGSPGWWLGWDPCSMRTRDRLLRRRPPRGSVRRSP